MKAVMINPSDACSRYITTIHFPGSMSRIASNSPVVPSKMACGAEMASRISKRIPANSQCSSVIMCPSFVREANRYPILRKDNFMHIVSFLHAVWISLGMD